MVLPADNGRAWHRKSIIPEVPPFVIKYEPEDFAFRFCLLIHKYVMNKSFPHIYGVLFFVCVILFSMIDDRPFIASDNWMQKYAHYMVFCSLCTSGPYNNT